ncbi:FUSC family protein [Roseivivax isoporae]|uniref:Membrane protein n=1 Tax=Roseivivax isoporae LMG 25204 TaxID=1449351 RepID=X7FB83_9RHOB|nr:FUSC family protein [Roseivivax isoporae]ETX30162.1 membrane protein [Roseivivax isoporae LMG 25204]
MLQALGRFLIDGERQMPWHAVLTTMLAVVVPVIAAVAIFGSPGAAVFIAAMPAHLAAKQSGIYAATGVTLMTSMGGVLALGSLVLSLQVAAILSVITAIGFRHGLATPCLRALFTWTVFTGPVLPEDQKALILALSIAAIFWSVGVTWAMGHAADAAQDDASSPEYSLLFGAALGVGLVLSVWVGNTFFGAHGFWFPLTFAVLWIPPFGELFSRTAKRSLGTVAGVAVALGLAFVVEEVVLRAAIAILALPLAFRILPRSSVAFVTLLTVAVIEALSLVSDVERLAFERVYSMAAAALMAVVLGVIALWILRRIDPEAIETLKSPDPEADHSVAARPGAPERTERDALAGR